MAKKIKIFLISFLSLLSILAIGTLVFVGLSVFDGLTNQVTNAESIRNDQRFFNSLNFDLDTFLNNYQIEPLSIASTFENHNIPAQWIKTDATQTKGVIIAIHGLGGTKQSVYPVATLFLKLGYDVFVYDQRSSGENLAKHNTFGYLERYDFLDCLTHITSHVDEDQQIIAWGESFGGATLAMALDDARAAHIDKVIFDSALIDVNYVIHQVLSDVSTRQHIPLDILLKTGDIALQTKLGFSLGDLTPIQHASKTNADVLIFSSTADEVTPTFMSEQLYNAIVHNRKELVVVDGVEHAMIFNTEAELYKRTLIAFLTD